MIMGKTYAIVMAGGSGTRFWPASRANKPKQFLDLFGGGTMIQHTVRRIEELVPAERVFVITNQAFVGLVKEQLPEIPAENIVAEPVAKNTAPCIAIGAELIRRKDPDAVMIVLPSDHTISDEPAFRNVLQTGVDYARANKALITIGIRPNRPETGYGYIQLKENAYAQGTFEKVYSVKTFAEKPDLATAKRFLASGDFLWNSGMFIWHIDTIMKAFEKLLPETFKELQKASDLMNRGLMNEAISEFFHSVNSISIDYGIMEKADAVYVVPGNFGWNDVGSWTAVHELSEKDENGNALKAAYAIVDSTRNSLIASKSGKLIAIVGLDDVAVVETEDAILVTSLKHAQNVKNITAALKGKFEPFR
jgi:mannose-1-phosphate guanylyltransferase